VPDSSPICPQGATVRYLPSAEVFAKAFSETEAVAVQTTITHLDI